MAWRGIKRSKRTKLDNRLTLELPMLEAMASYTLGAVKDRNIPKLYDPVDRTIHEWSAEPKSKSESTTDSHTSTETTEPGPSPKGSSLIDDPPASGLGPVAGGVVHEAQTAYLIAS
eukprot:g33455.t1